MRSTLSNETLSTASTSFDGPATTDAALAALAAEAGLIDPEPEKDEMSQNNEEILKAAEMITPAEDSPVDTPLPSEAITPMETASGLAGGSTDLSDFVGLKGGSPCWQQGNLEITIIPRPIWQLGLRGGNKENNGDADASASVLTPDESGSSDQNSINGSSLILKTESEESDEKMDELNNSSKIEPLADHFMKNQHMDIKMEVGKCIALCSYYSWAEKAENKTVQQFQCSI